MRPAQSLARLLYCLRRRLRSYRAAVDFLPLTVDPLAEAVIVRATLDSLNAWSEFARAYYLSCCIGARTAGGKVAKPTTAPIPTPAVALDRAIQIMRPRVFGRGGPWRRTDEPAWRDPATLKTLATHLALTNLGSVTLGLSISTSALVHLPAFRNYFGHRNAETAGIVGRLAPTYLSTARERAAAVLRKQLPGRPRCVLSDFLVDIENVAAALCS